MLFVWFKQKGIEFLVENGLLTKDDEQDIAMFLYRGEGLNKTAIGDYLGERSNVNERVLKAFVALHDFTDLILVQVREENRASASSPYISTLLML